MTVTVRVRSDMRAVMLITIMMTVIDSSDPGEVWL